MRLGHGGRQARQTEAVRSEKCVGRRSRAWDGLWAIAVCFTRALQKCAGHVNMCDFSHNVAVSVTKSKGWPFCNA